MSSSEPNPEKEFRRIEAELNLLGSHVETTLLDRGWEPTTLDVPDNESLEFFWPPTAPIGYGYLPETPQPALIARPQMQPVKESPWLQPTRIVWRDTSSAWAVHYGTAKAQAAAPTVLYAKDGALVAQLEKIEWWPMTLEEARNEQACRLMALTHAAAYDQFYLSEGIRTEPYLRQHQELVDQIDLERKGNGNQSRKNRTPGSLEARLQIVDAESWVSSVRSERAGGENWRENNS